MKVFVCVWFGWWGIFLHAVKFSFQQSCNNNDRDPFANVEILRGFRRVWWIHWFMWRERNSIGNSLLLFFVLRWVDQIIWFFFHLVVVGAAAALSAFRNSIAYTQHIIWYLFLRLSTIQRTVCCQFFSMDTLLFCYFCCCYISCRWNLSLFFPSYWMFILVRLTRNKCDEVIY